MSDSHLPARQPIGRRRRLPGAASEPINIEGVMMPGIDNHLTPSKALYKSILQDVETLEQKLDVEKVKLHEKVQQAQQHGLRILRAVPEQYWGPEWEAKANEKLRAARSEWEIPLTTRVLYLGLAKTVALHAGCSPRDIVGVQTRLVFDRSYKTRDMARRYPPCPLRAWPSTFCEQLNRLVVHPAWYTGQPGGRATLLTLALQYSVILRTGDRRQWDMLYRHSFVNLIQEYIGNGMPARAAHGKARRELLEKGEFLSIYHISNVFKAIEDIVVDAAPQDISRHPFYFITYEDLENLTRALDSIADPDTGAVFWSTEVQYKMVVATRPAREVIPTNSDIDTFHENIILEECRRIIYLERMNCIIPVRTEPLSDAHPTDVDNEPLSDAHPMDVDNEFGDSVVTGNDYIAPNTPEPLPETTGGPFAEDDPMAFDQQGTEADLDETTEDEWVVKERTMFIDCAPTVVQRIY